MTARVEIAAGLLGSLDGPPDPDAETGSGDHQAGGSPRPWPVLDDDLDVIAQDHEKTDKSIERKARQSAASECGDLRLIDMPQAGGYVAHCPALPGCCSQGDTREEAIGNAREAIAAYRPPVRRSPSLAAVSSRRAVLSMPTIE